MVTSLDTFDYQDGDVEKLQAIMSDLLIKMGLACTVTSQYLEEEQAVLLDIDPGDAAGLLIGKQGETLFSLQSIVSLIFKAQNDRKVRVLVNVADYRDKQNKRLTDLADQTAERALVSGSAQNLYNLTPSQRRTIHTHLTQNEKVTTESSGEGRERFLVVKPK